MLAYAGVHMYVNEQLEGGGAALDEEIDELRGFMLTYADIC
jgi:hypothetical protein